MSVRSTKSTRHTRVVGEARATLARAWSKQYHTGKTIREIADANDRSYGFVRNVILESGAQLRKRGGSKLNPSQRRST
jgi:Helix-turn-helix domain